MPELSLGPRDLARSDGTVILAASVVDVSAKGSQAW